MFGLNDEQDGGPAFPNFNGDDRNNNGMTLRDYFANHALEADIEEIITEIREHNWRFPYEKKPVVTRQQARYIHADRMIEARKL